MLFNDKLQHYTTWTKGINGQASLQSSQLMALFWFFDSPKQSSLYIMSHVGTMNE